MNPTTKYLCQANYRRFINLFQFLHVSHVFLFTNYETSIVLGYIQFAVKFKFSKRFSFKNEYYEAYLL